MIWKSLTVLGNRDAETGKTLEHPFSVQDEERIASYHQALQLSAGDENIPNQDDSAVYADSNRVKRDLEWTSKLVS